MKKYLLIFLFSILCWPLFSQEEYGLDTLLYHSNAEWSELHIRKHYNILDEEGIVGFDKFYFVMENGKTLNRNKTVLQYYSLDECREFKMLTEPMLLQANTYHWKTECVNSPNKREVGDIYYFTYDRKEKILMVANKFYYVKTKD
jgi:hypothetical protein